MSNPRAIQGEVEAQILDNLKTGAFVEEAAAAAGVAKSTVYAEMERNPDFKDAVTRARGEARLAAVECVRRAAADGDWKAAAFYLERTDPQSWGRSTRHEHSGPAGGPIKTEQVPDYADPEVRDAADKLLGRNGDRA